MTTKLSSKGQVVLPGTIRKRLGLRAGDSFEAKLEGERIILIPQRPKRRQARVVKDRLTGFRVISVGPKAPKLTSEMVRELLADFP